MAPEICLNNSPSHSSPDAAALRTSFGIKQEKVPDTFFRYAQIGPSIQRIRCFGSRGECVGVGSA